MGESSPWLPTISPSEGRGCSETAEMVTAALSIYLKVLINREYQI